jgi:membrane protease YdiL (CAAX protease family)
MNSRDAFSARSRVAGSTGLALALGAPFLLAFLPRHGRQRITDVRQDAQLVAFEWLVSVTLIIIVLRWERLPLRSIGFRVPRWPDIAAMLVTVIGIVVGGGLFVLATHSTDPGKLAGATPAEIATVPLALRIALFITAGFCEELMFRAYAIERLAMFTGKLWLGGLIAAVLFTLGHLARYGFSLPLIGVFIISCFLTGLYLWRRNIWLCAMIHGAADAMGLVIGPAIHGHRG